MEHFLSCFPGVPNNSPWQHISAGKRQKTGANNLVVDSEVCVHIVGLQMSGSLVEQRAHHDQYIVAEIDMR